MKFELPISQSSIIKVIGVGGGGSNAVNHMYNLGFKGVDFIVCNTDKQALDASPVPTKLQLGPSLTEGRGAGSIPEIGANAANETIEEIKDFLSDNTKMVFVTAGMGGGTGTGAAPVIAKLAKGMGILTVGIVTVPFNFEGRKRRQQAEGGLDEMRKSVDTLLVINNERLREIHGNLTLGNAFAEADSVLSTAAKGISDVISVTGAINVDFNDVNTVMKDSGVAVMGSATAEGENRAINAVEQAMTSPLLNDNDIEGARYVLLNITYGDEEVLMDEITNITDYIQNAAGSSADVIWGHGYDETLGKGICVTLIATGFNQSPITGFEKAPEKTVMMLEDKKEKEIVSPLASPTDDTHPYNTSSEEKSFSEPYLKTEKDITITNIDVPASEIKKVEIKEDEKAPSMNWEIKTVIEDEIEMDEREDERAIANDNLEEIAEKVETETFKVNFENPRKENNQKEEKEVKRYFLDEADADLELPFDSVEKKEENKREYDVSKEEQQKRANERIERIRNYTSHLNTAEGLNELEKEPAFVRRNIDIELKNHSKEEHVSRFEVSENKEEKGKTQLRDTNSFLHDNVD